MGETREQRQAREMEERTQYFLEKMEPFFHKGLFPFIMIYCFYILLQLVFGFTSGGF